MSPEAMTPGKKRNALVRTMPILDWLPHYKRSWLRPDLLAGLSVWALVIPQALLSEGLDVLEHAVDTLAS